MENRLFWNEKRYHSFDFYLKQTFGEKLYKIALNGGMTCPNRDGSLSKGGCIFCSEGGSGEFASSPDFSIIEQIEEGKIRLQNKQTSHRYIAYFQAFTNTYAPVSYLRKLYLEAINHPDIAVLSIATRPDCLAGDVLTLLEECNQIKPVWIELGLQTIHEKTEKLIRRGYPLSCFEEALVKLKARGLHVIVHTILGLPGEAKEDMLATMDYLSASKIDGIKLQLLHILKNTELALLYEEHPFPVLTLDEYTDIVLSCIERLDPAIVIHRITGDAPKEALLAPLWSGHKKQVLNTIHKAMKERDSWQGKNCNL